MADSVLKQDATRTGVNLVGKDLNTLPDIFASYGFWGGSNVTNAPISNPAGCVLVTFPASGSGTQLQLFVSSGALRFRIKTYQNTWSEWQAITP